jgi:hypothetical protein
MELIIVIVLLIIAFGVFGGIFWSPFFWLLLIGALVVIAVSSRGRIGR